MLILCQYYVNRYSESIKQYTNLEVDRMGKKDIEQQIQEQKNHNMFNSITQKSTPENQNQTHNSRKEGIQPINQKR